MTLSKRDLDLVADELAAFCPADVAALYRPRWNVAPSDTHPVLRRTEAHRRQLELGRWGFPGRKGTGLLINARSESAASRPAFRAALAQGRCVIPADGFYEWSGQGAERRPCWLHRADGRLLLLAGLHQRNDPAPESGGRADQIDRGDQADQGPSGLVFTVLTTSANRLVARLHDRMPVILAPEDVDRWLAEGPSALLRPAPEETLVATAVSRRANSVKNDDPACLEPAGDHPDSGDDGTGPDAGEAPEARGRRRQLALF